jgi:hypothetical protein
MRKVLFLFTIAAFLITSSAWAADLSGNWTVKFTKVDGAQDSLDITIKDAGGNLTITGNHGQLGALAGSGMVKGDDVNMDIKATGSLPLEFIFTGKAADNKISGTRDIKLSAGASGGQASGGAGQGGQGGQAPTGGGQAPASGAQGSAAGQASNTFTAEKK